MPYQGNPGVSKLGKVLSQRMAKQRESGLILDYGSIEGDYSLKANTFPIPIPKGDYTVCRCAGGLSFEIGGGQHSGHESGNGTHGHQVSLPAIKPGDRVLIAWVQNEVTVIDVIVPASGL